jgi:hypothetical protein
VTSFYLDGQQGMNWNDSDEDMPNASPLEEKKSKIEKKGKGNRKNGRIEESIRRDERLVGQLIR